MRRWAGARLRKAEAMSLSVQAEVLRKMVAAEEQRSIERAVHIGCKTRRSAALRNWYRIQPWHYPCEDFERGV